MTNNSHFLAGGSSLPLVKEPDMLLHQVSIEVEQVDDEVRKLAKDMLATMKKNHGLGLAAVQVGMLKKVIVIDSNYLLHNDELKDNEKELLESNNPLVMINARITKSANEKTARDEGCLSLPGVLTSVSRPKHIEVEYLDINGKSQSMAFGENLLSACVQHEIDHTEGKVLLDRISRLKKRHLHEKAYKI